MTDSPLSPRMVRTPELGRGEWLNAQGPITLANLRGGVVLIDFWDYTCINCVRTLPYLRTWHGRYQRHGLTIIGVHAPEFAFGRERGQIAAALGDLDIPYPVLMDNDFATWDAFANRFWPAKYLIDAAGYIRYSSHGEGGYAAFERAIQAALRENDPALDLPPLMNPLRTEDAPGAVCYRPTPELHAGLDRGALNNPEGYGGGVPMLYSLPPQRPHGGFYVGGAWAAGQEYLAFEGQTEGVIALPYEAVGVYAVLTPHVEAVERILHPQTVGVEVWQDDLPLPPERYGADLSADGRVLVDRPRMYHLVQNPGFEQHELTLRVRSRGFAVYAFTFTSCVRQPQDS